MDRRIILLISLLLVAGGGFVAYRMYQEKPEQASDRDADVTIEAEALYQAFVKDEVTAGKQYNDKVVQVAGAVREVSTSENGPTNVMLETSDALSSIMCEFPAGTSVPASLAKGSKVTIKGFCAGFNLDVQLTRCSIVE
jgi:hypothetical protein